MKRFACFQPMDENVADELSDHLHNLNDERKGLAASMVRGSENAHGSARDAGGDCHRQSQMAAGSVGAFWPRDWLKITGGRLLSGGAERD